MSVKLDVGSGGPAASYLGEGWLGVDPYVGFADVSADMNCLPYDNNTVDEIHTSHALEHIGRHEVAPTLREWYRVLVPGGRVTIKVPDLEWCVRHWLDHKHSLGWNIDIIFGNQNHEGEFHKTGFTTVTLTQYVVDAGFVVDTVTYIDTHSQQTICLGAHKPE